jgi:hypothetical protein
MPPFTRPLKATYPAAITKSRAHRVRRDSYFAEASIAITSKRIKSNRRFREQTGENGRKTEGSAF